jgi:SAM-dependent methyltransferase
MNVEYNHAENLHTLFGPQVALPLIFPEGLPQSILDVGCGTGTWLRAAINLGAKEVFGIDGIDIPKEELHFSQQCFKRCDLTSLVDLNRRFDAVFCFEVAEHLDAQFAPVLVETLTKHADRVYFSAACPEQIGQHHANCQWPSYWQYHFNRCGYICEDSIREKIWEDDKIEWWYRQNLFVAHRDPKRAGSESRIRSLIHPDHFLTKISMAEQSVQKAAFEAYEDGVASVGKGSLPVSEYLRLPISGLFSKIKRKACGAK